MLIFVFEAINARQQPAKKRSLQGVNEHVDLHALILSGLGENQQPKGFCYHQAEGVILRTFFAVK